MRFDNFASALVKPFLFIMILLGSSFANAATSIVRTDVTTNAVILPDARYSLLSPWDTVVQQAPITHQAIFPPYIAQLPVRSNGAPPIASVYPDTVAILALPKPTARASYLKLRKSAILRAYLQAYGLGTLSNTDERNVPWKTLYAGTRVDPGRQPFAEALLALLPGDETALRAILTVVNGGRLQSSPYLALLREADETAANFPELSDQDKLFVLHDTLVFKIRQLIGLNSDDYNIALGGHSIPILPSNEAEPTLGDLPSFRFQVARYSDGNDLGIQNLNVFLSYWTTVQSQNLYNADDFRLLNYISMAKVSADQVSTLDKLSSVEQALGSQLIEDVTKALQAVQSWRAGEKVLAGSLRGQRKLPDFAQAMMAADSTLTNAEIGYQKTGVIFALNYAHAIPNRMDSADDAMVWLADQFRDPRHFNGKLIGVDETTILKASPALPDGESQLQGFSLSDYVTLPADPGTREWSNAFNGLILGQNDVPGVPADELPGALKETPDPFRDLIWQMTMTTTPSLDNGSAAQANADDIYQSGKGISIDRIELERQIVVRSASVKQEADALAKDGVSEQSATADGRFIVPEPAMIDLSQVKSGDHVNVGATIAILRPLFRFHLDSKVNPNSHLASQLVSGTTITFRLKCNGPFAISTDQEAAILRRGDANSVVKWLVALRAYFFDRTVFTGSIYAVDRDPAEAKFLGITALDVRVSSEVPNAARAIPLNVYSLMGAEPTAVAAALVASGFRIDQSRGNSTSTFVPPLGPLSPGDQCQATYIDKDSGADAAAPINAKWNVLVGNQK